MERGSISQSQQAGRGGDVGNPSGTSIPRSARQIFESGLVPHDFVYLLGQLLDGRPPPGADIKNPPGRGTGPGGGKSGGNGIADVGKIPDLQARAGDGKRQAHHGAREEIRNDAPERARPVVGAVDIEISKDDGGQIVVTNPKMDQRLGGIFADSIWGMQFFGLKAEILRGLAVPTLQRRMEPGEKHQIVLVANNYTAPNSPAYRRESVRNILMPLAESGYDLKVWGNNWTSSLMLYRLAPELCGGSLAYEDLAKVYSGAEIVLGLQFSGLSQTQTSCRIFEVLACQAFYLGPDTKGTRFLFEPGRHLAVSGSAAQTMALARYYLEHQSERERIAAAGQLEVYRKHTYIHRAREFLACVEEAL